MGFLERLQKLPESRRKTILWSIIIIIAILFALIWLKNIKKSLENFPKAGVLKNIELPQIPEGLLKVPKEEIQENIPQLSEEELKELEYLLEEEKKKNPQEVGG
ncbi:MAG: hypothetical protein AAB565_01225 [Patescibacteria group bacterium]